MLDNNSLIKYFVRVPSGITFNGAEVSAASGNTKKIYFDENTQQIWVRGKAFSLDKDNATKLETLIGSDTNKSVREIATSVVNATLALTDEDNVINKLSEVLDWFNNLPEGDQGALALVNKVGSPAVLYTAEDEAQNPEHVEGTVKTAATGLYKLIEDSIGDAISNIDLSPYATITYVDGKIGSLGNKVEAQAAVLYADETEYNAAKGTELTAEQFAELSDVEKTKTAAIEAVPYTNVGEIIADLNTKINTLTGGGLSNVVIGSTQLTISNNTATITKAALQSELFTNAYVSEPLTYSYLGVTVSVTEQNGELTGLNVDPSGLANRVSVVEEFDPWEEYQTPAEPGE